MIIALQFIAFLARSRVAKRRVHKRHLIFCDFSTVIFRLLFVFLPSHISIDVQGITGRRKSFTSLPYSKIQFFAIQTPGFAELVPDSELVIMFANGFTATYEFKGRVDISVIGRMISEYVLSR